MLFPCIDLRKITILAVAYASSCLAGCGNSCVVAYSVNGNGGVIVKAGDPPPSCMLNQAQGMVRASLTKVATCETCTPVAQVQHLYVALRGLQIHTTAGYGDSEGWVDLAPELAASPPQFDVVGDSLPDADIVAAIVPAGSYDLVRVQFVTESKASEPGDTRCGGGTANCLVLGDTRTEPLGFSGDDPVLLLPLQQNSGPLLVLPDSKSHLRIQLGVRRAERASVPAAKAPMQLLGEVAVERIASPN